MGHDEIPKQEHMMQTEIQYPEFENFEADGYILDIGGGGEGIIGQLKGDQVISIDKNKGELEEANSKNLKIVMDATDLQFLDNSFNTAAAFFTFMYMDYETKEKTFKEVFRVLKPNGKFFIWDVFVPAKKEKEEQQFFVAVIEVNLPERKVQTGYGCRFLAQDAKYFKDLADKTGFELISQSDKDQIYRLEFKKKI